MFEEEEMLTLGNTLKYINLTWRSGMYALRDANSIIKEAGGHALVVWRTDDYLRAAEKLLGDTKVYEIISGDDISLLVLNKHVCTPNRHN